MKKILAMVALSLSIAVQAFSATKGSALDYVLCAKQTRSANSYTGFYFRKDSLGGPQYTPFPTSERFHYSSFGMVVSSLEDRVVSVNYGKMRLVVDALYTKLPSPQIAGLLSIVNDDIVVTCDEASALVIKQAIQKGMHLELEKNP